MAAKVIAFQVEVNGVQVAITNQEELNKAVKDTNKAFQQADFGSDKYAALEKQLIELRAEQKRLTDSTKQQAREQEIAADKGKGSYRALNAELVKLKNEYRELSAAERNIVGPELLQRIQKLDTELKDIDASMGQYQRNVGNYASAFAGLGGIDLASFATIPGAIAAVGAAAVQGVQYVAEFTKEFTKLRGEIQTLTGATGDDLDRFTANVAAIADTFGQETNDIVQAANAASKQLGISFDEALKNIEEGFIAGSNANGEFLDSVKEYPTFFKEAGLSADQFFAVLNQSAQQGIFSDKGVDVVKEVTLRLRELPQATQDALGGIGIASADIRKQIEEEGIGAAIATVSKRLGELRADSPEVGTAIADIFGSPGENAGLQFLISLQNINQATGSLIDSTNTYQQQQIKTLQINKDFAAIQNEIAKELAGTGASLEQVGTIIQTKLLEFFLQLVRNVREFLSIFSPLISAFSELAKTLGLVDSEGRKTEATQKALNKIFELSQLPLKLVVQAITGLVQAYTFVIQKGQDFLQFLGVIEKRQQGTAKASQQVVDSLLGYVGASGKATNATKENTKSTDDYTKKIKAAAVATDAFAKGSIAALRKEVQDLQKNLEQASPYNAPGILQKLLKAEEALKEAEEFQAQLRALATRSAKDIEEIQRIGGSQIADNVISTSAAVENAKAEAADIAAIRESSEKRRLEIIKSVNQKILDEQELFQQAFQEIQSSLFSSLGTVLDLVSQSGEQRTENEIKALEAKYEKEIQLAEGNTTKQAALEKELDEKRKAIEKEQFERGKRLAILQAIIGGAQAVVSTLAAPPGAADILTLSALRAFQVAFTVATTIAQIAAISSQKFARGGFTGRGGNRDETGKRIAGIVHENEYVVPESVLQTLRGRQLVGELETLRTGAYRPIGASVRPDVQGIVIRNPQASAMVMQIAPESMEEMATMTAKAVAVGAKEGVEIGLVNANREGERQTRVNKRLGV